MALAILDPSTEFPRNMLVRPRWLAEMVKSLAWLAGVSRNRQLKKCPRRTCDSDYGQIRNLNGTWSRYSHHRSRFLHCAASPDTTYACICASRRILSADLLELRKRGDERVGGGEEVRGWGRDGQGNGSHKAVVEAWRDDRTTCIELYTT
ncbi:hypothetical protein EK21DRAFT_84521 [Setomelanomma holmii]|uniref:Uncharacterized protein n=1 Tax=Setomelanomma holmii TaxID=210430 RepID=A0A9P4HJ09_9PLEO|nr:hypothetical protein EK21DRAFT_84521 [Setomelanomma holmii]